MTPKNTAKKSGTHKVAPQKKIQKKEEEKTRILPQQAASRTAWST
jgi:hypothetical protein